MKLFYTLKKNFLKNPKKSLKNNIPHYFSSTWRFRSSVIFDIDIFFLPILFCFILFSIIMLVDWRGQQQDAAWRIKWHAPLKQKLKKNPTTTTTTIQLSPHSKVKVVVGVSRRRWQCDTCLSRDRFIFLSFHRCCCFLFF